MASQGPNSPGTASGTSWGTPNNVFASDNAYSTFSLNGTNVTTNQLSATNFGFSVPSGATINGVVVEIERKVNSTSRNPKDNSVLLIKGGTAQGTDKASASVWPTTDAYATYGGAADLWGLTLTDSDVNASNFGAQLQCKRDAGAKGTTTYSIDHVRITVYYTGAGAAAGTYVVRSQAVRRASSY